VSSTCNPLPALRVLPPSLPGRVPGLLLRCHYVPCTNPGKLQIEIGLLADGEGEPLAVRVFKGNTADPVPQDGMPEQIRVVKEQFGVGELAFVGIEAW